MHTPVAPKGRLEFLHTKPPQNYIAGHGRGATGFTTRSDIGPALQTPFALKGRLHTKPPQNYVAGHGRGATGFTTRSDIGPALQAPVAPKGRLHTKPPLNYVAGYCSGATGFTTHSDIGPARAATIGAAGPPGLGRGRGRGPRDEDEEKGFDGDQKFERYRALNPNTAEQNADLKRKLHTISRESVPEKGDCSLRNKKKRFESFVPVPDTEKAAQEKQHLRALDPKNRVSR